MLNAYTNKEGYPGYGGGYGVHLSPGGRARREENCLSIHDGMQARGTHLPGFNRLENTGGERLVWLALPSFCLNGRTAAARRGCSMGG